MEVTWSSLERSTRDTRHEWQQKSGQMLDNFVSIYFIETRCSERSGADVEVTDDIGGWLLLSGPRWSRRGMYLFSELEWSFAGASLPIRMSVSLVSPAPTTQREKVSANDSILSTSHDITA